MMISITFSLFMCFLAPLLVGYTLVSLLPSLSEDKWEWGNLGRKRHLTKLGVVSCWLSGVLFFFWLVQLLGVSFYNDSRGPWTQVAPGVIRDVEGDLKSGRVSRVVRDYAYPQGIYRDWRFKWVFNNTTCSVIYMTAKEVALENGKIYAVGKVERERLFFDTWMLHTDLMNMRGRTFRVGTVRGYSIEHSRPARRVARRVADVWEGTF